MFDARKKLSEPLATAICGNGILSSSLYVSGIVISYAGVFAPLVFLLTAFVLFLYKKVYTEVVEALPINGGVYNCLLNSTSKSIAAMGGILTFLTYIATAVLSAKIAVEYLHTILPVAVLPTTVLLLLFFAFLVIGGVHDSARVALVIFSIHVFSLSVFLILGLLHVFSLSSFFPQNAVHTAQIIPRYGGFFEMLFLAFSVSLLGVSSYESSANFVEEQKRGVFRKTLRNMFLVTTFFNPLLALVLLSVLPYSDIVSSQNFLLARASGVIGGSFFQTIMALNAFSVLSGAVLTTYIGVSGLLYRMATDRCFPSLLTVRNSRGAYPRIVLSFFFLCLILLFSTRGELSALSGMYTLSFLSVMSMFALGNLLLKETRSDLKRSYRAPIIVPILAFLATASGILGTLRINPETLSFFQLAFFPSFFLVFLMVHQDLAIRAGIRLTAGLPVLQQILKHRFHHVVSGTLVVFIRHPRHLHSILSYINRNETGRNIILVTCRDEQEGNRADENFRTIKSLIPSLTASGVFPHLSLSVRYEKELFGPTLIKRMSKELHILTNRIFIGSIHHDHAFDYADLGGVRIIF